MERFFILFFGMHAFLFAFTGCSEFRKTCPRPDFPEKGDYIPKQNYFERGDAIVYRCSEEYTLIGNDISRCRSNGYWSRPTPFCDRKTVFKIPHALLSNSTQHPIPEVTDSDRSTCFLWKQGENIEVNLDKPKVLSAVRILFLGRGDSQIVISTGKTRCGDTSVIFHETSDWYTVHCKNNVELADTAIIQQMSYQSDMRDVCEIEVYVREEDGCENPPEMKVANGFFEVSRKEAKLICQKGYKSNFNRLVCEGNIWLGPSLHCYEEEKPTKDSETIIYTSAGITMVLLMIALLGAAI